jgi:hypothetical protein
MADTPTKFFPPPPPLALFITRTAHAIALQNAVEVAESELRALLARCEAQYYSSHYR